MIWKDLPSLSSLRAFSAVAGTGSYSKAGAHLNVTHAAISQQVKALERFLGISLVVREGRGIALSGEGARLARELDTGFSAMQRAIERLSGTEAKRPVQITMSPAFAVEWLMPRLSEFQHLNPDITLMLNPSGEILELKPGGIDLAIRYGSRDKLPEQVTPILVSDMVVVGAPALVRDIEPDDPAALMDLPWLQELGTSGVADWFQRRGVKVDRPLMITEMPGNLIMDAVRRGEGITDTIGAFFEDDIRLGRMVELFSDPDFGIFHLVMAPGAVRPPVAAFAKWLQSRAG